MKSIAVAVAGKLIECISKIVSKICIPLLCLQGGREESVKIEIAENKPGKHDTAEDCAFLPGQLSPLEHIDEYHAQYEDGRIVSGQKTEPQDCTAAEVVASRAEVGTQGKEEEEEIGFQTDILEDKGTGKGTKDAQGQVVSF